MAEGVSMQLNILSQQHFASLLTPPPPPGVLPLCQMAHTSLLESTALLQVKRSVFDQNMYRWRCLIGSDLPESLVAMIEQ